MTAKNLATNNIKIKVNKDVFLKVLSSNDVYESYVEWLNDYEITKYTEQRFFKHTLESTKNFVSQKYDSETDLLFGIFLNHLHIGNIKLGPINFDHMSAEVSYFLGEKRLWGKGIATNCLNAIIHFAFTDLGLKKINAGYYENNISSAKVLEKCGFSIEGIQISNIIFEKKRINSVKVGHTPK